MRATDDAAAASRSAASRCSSARLAAPAAIESAGTPIAALAWSHGTCVEAALCEQTGSQTVLDPSMDDETAAQSLAEAIEKASELPHRRVQEVGLNRFDARRHFEALAGTP